MGRYLGSASCRLARMVQFLVGEVYTRSYKLFDRQSGRWGCTLFQRIGTDSSLDRLSL